MGSQDPRVGEAELRKVCGVQQTNGAQLHLSPGHGRGLAVYLVQVPPSTAGHHYSPAPQTLLNHSCLCNTVSRERPGGVEVRARFDIQAGQEISTSYIRPSQVVHCCNAAVLHSGPGHPGQAAVSPPHLAVLVLLPALCRPH